MPLTRRAYELGAIAMALALIGVLAFLGVQARAWLLPNGQPVFGDFIAFWGAGRAALDGQAALVHDPQILQAYQRGAVPGFDIFAGWNSPPTFLLIATTLAPLPYPLAALAFLAASAALYLIAARKLLPDPRTLIFALTLPAALYHLGSVQTGLLAAGVSGLALYWLDARPRAAGALIALLAIKPHLAILWPVLLALSGRWRVFAVATLSTLAFALVAGLAFGFESYARFFDNLPATQALIAGQRVTTPAAASLYASLIAFGAPHALAIGAHALSALAAAALALLIFRGGERRTQGAALCAATLIVLPYVFFYDFTLLAIGAALLGKPRDSFEIAAFACAWAAGFQLVLGYITPLPFAPLAAWLVLLSVVRRGGSVDFLQAPAPRT